MLNHLLVRLTIGCLLVLGIKLSALYFLPMVLLLNTHHKEFSGGNKNGAHWAPFYIVFSEARPSHSSDYSTCTDAVFVVPEATSAPETITTMSPFLPRPDCSAISLPRW